MDLKKQLLHYFPELGTRRYGRPCGESEMRYLRATIWRGNGIEGSAHFLFGCCSQPASPLGPLMRYGSDRRLRAMLTVEMATQLARAEVVKWHAHARCRRDLHVIETRLRGPMATWDAHCRSGVRLGWRLKKRSVPVILYECTMRITTSVHPLYCR